MRTTKDVSGWGEINYVYEGGLLLQMDYLGRIFNFSYDANGTPVSFRVSEEGQEDEYYYYGVNSRGDIVSIYNVAGAEVIQYTYDAYGKPLSTSAVSNLTTIADVNPLRYRGYVYDKETGLYYLQSRYYDPVTCRFINADGYCSTGQGITGNNMFAYCNNNPIVYADYSGCWTIGLNLNANITVILGVSISIGIYFDDNGNFDVQWSYAVPWVNDTASVGVFDAGIGIGLQYMNVDTVDDLCGYSSSTGFSAGDLAYVGLDVLSTSRIAEPDDTIDGIQITGGIGIGVDIHASNTYTSSLLRKQDTNNLTSNMSSDFTKYYHRHTINEIRTGGKIY